MSHVPGRTSFTYLHNLMHVRFIQRVSVLWISAFLTSVVVKQDQGYSHNNGKVSLLLRNYCKHTALKRTKKCPNNEVMVLSTTEGGWEGESTQFLQPMTLGSLWSLRNRAHVSCDLCGMPQPCPKYRGWFSWGIVPWQLKSKCFATLWRREKTSVCVYKTLNITADGGGGENEHAQSQWWWGGVM